MTRDVADELLDRFERLINLLILRSLTTSGKGHLDSIGKDVAETREEMKRIMVDHL